MAILPQWGTYALRDIDHESLADAMITAEASLRRRSDTAPAKTSPEALATMARLLAYSGLRFGECIALRVSDVDTANRRIEVNKSVAQVRDRVRNRVTRRLTRTEPFRSSPPSLPTRLEM